MFWGSHASPVRTALLTGPIAVLFSPWLPPARVRFFQTNPAPSKRCSVPGSIRGIPCTFPLRHAMKFTLPNLPPGLFSHIFPPTNCAGASASALIVVAQSFYHRWRAFVDGQPSTLWRANYAFQAVEVPAGKNQVRLVYVDRAFQSVCAVSAVSLLACVILWLRWRRDPVPEPQP